MAGRYLETGAQLGILIAHIENKQEFEAQSQIDQIVDKQYVGSSNNNCVCKNNFTPLSICYISFI